MLFEIMNRPEKLLTIAVCLIVLLGIGLRFFDLRADPPKQFSTSAGDYFDGYSNAHAARSYVLFGNARPDQWDPYVYSPPYVLLQIPWFKMFGTGVWAINSFGALFSVLSILAGIMCFRGLSRSTVVASLLFAFSYILVQYGRVALFENLMIFFMICAVACLAVAPLTPVRCIGIGAFSMLAYASKAISIYFLPAIAAGVLLAGWKTYTDNKQFKAGLKVIVWTIAGWLIVFLPWLFLFRIPNAGEIQRIGEWWTDFAFPGSVADALMLASKTPAFFVLGKSDQLWIIALIISAIVLYFLLTRPSACDPLAVVMVIWFACGLCLLSILKYNPPRYFLPLMPAVMGLCAYGLGRLIDLEAFPVNPKCWWIAYPLEIIVIAVCLRFYLAYKIPFANFIPSSMLGGWGKLLACFLMACILWGIVRLALYHRKQPVRISRIVRTGIVSIVCLYFVAGNLRHTVKWLKHREYTIVETGRKLDKIQGMVVGGTSVLPAVSETRHKAVRIGRPDRYNWEDPFSKYGLTHLFLTDYAGEISRFHRLYPVQMANAREIDKMNMCGYTYRLFELNIK